MNSNEPGDLVLDALSQFNGALLITEDESCLYPVELNRDKSAGPDDIHSAII